MKRISYLLIAFILFFETTYVAFAEEASVRYSSNISESLNSVSRGASRLSGAFKKTTQLGPCEINFVRLVNGKLPEAVFTNSSTNLWSKNFKERLLLDELMDIPEFKNPATRMKYFEGYTKLIYKDEVYVENVSKLVNQMYREGLIKFDDLKALFINRKYPYAKFTFSYSNQSLISSLEFDPQKLSLIDDLIKQSDIGQNAAAEYAQIFKRSNLNAEQLQLAVDSGLVLKQSRKDIELTRSYFEFLEKFKKNAIGKAKVNSALKNIDKIYDPDNLKWYDISKLWKPHKQFLSDAPENLNRIEAVKNLLSGRNLPSDIKRQYRKYLTESRLSQENIEFLAKQNPIFLTDDQSIRRFKEYMIYLDYIPEYRMQKALKSFNKAINPKETNVRVFGKDFNLNESLYMFPDFILPPHIQFLKQTKKVANVEKRKLSTIIQDMKQQQRKELSDELYELVLAKQQGLPIDEVRYAQVKKQINDTELPEELMKRAREQARGEANVFSRLLNGCNSGGSVRMQSAAKKFKRFKLALAVGGTPFFYLTKNWDKKDEDPFFWEKLGQEMAIGLFFTMVGNKIVTGTDKGFWGKYLEGYLKFGALDLLSAGSYDALFGANSYVRYFQSLYNGGEVKPSEVEKEFERLKNSETFDEDFQALMTFMEQKSEAANTKNLLDKYFNLSTYSSLDEDFKITQEDLESEEAREVMMELLAEKIYLMNMGDWEIFQTGNKGMDRWSFYRTRNLLFDMKGMAVNLAIFEIMCRMPAGAKGIPHWGLILGLTIGDWMLSGKFTYKIRREAINQ